MGGGGGKGAIPKNERIPTFISLYACMVCTETVSPVADSSFWTLSVLVDNVLGILIRFDVGVAAHVLLTDIWKDNYRPSDEAFEQFWSYYEANVFVSYS